MSEDFDKYHAYSNRKEEDSSTDDEIMDFLSKSKQSTVIPSTRKQDIWKEIDEVTKEHSSFNIRPFLAIAASLALIITVAYLLLSPAALVSPLELAQNTAIGEIENINLPDGSSVTLNAASTLTYIQHNQRQVTLNGEAFFEVKKGGKFTVLTAYGTVEVLGTSFNVYARDNRFEVICKTGKVKVTDTNNKTEVIIAPGEAVIQGVKSAIAIDKVDNWKNGEFYFENRSLDFVLDELSRQFNIEIIRPTNEERRFTGYFFNDSLEDALSSICLPLGLEFSIAKNSVMISEK